MRGAKDLVCTAFEGDRRIATGPLEDIIADIKKVADRGEKAPLLIFDQKSSHQVELDLRGTLAEAKARLAANSADSMVDSPSPPKKSKGPGRPKLGVVSKEVTLLPRHWEWLGQQRGGASVTLRRLVDEAKRRSEGWDQLKKAEESLYRFISVMAGNQPGFEEAARALYAGDADKFKKCSENWARDVREHALSMAEKVFYRGA